MKHKKLLVAMTAVAVVFASVVACSPKPNVDPGTPGTSEPQIPVSATGNPIPNVTKAATTPATDKWGIVTAEAWSTLYPYEYQSYLENASNTPPKEDYLDGTYAALGYPAGTGDCTSTLPEGWTYVDAGKANFLETNPEIKTLGLGYGYAKYYTEPASHLFSVWTVTHNGRLGDAAKAKAACFSCKAPQWSAYVTQNGMEVNSEAFNDFAAELTENVSCYSCHGNDPMNLEVTREEWKMAMGSDYTKASMEGQVCGQCHCDYSMAPGTSIPTSPYDNGRPDMLPEKALKWYDEHEFADWTYASTGAKMISARHAEYEFIYGGEGSTMQKKGYDCNDCHMATKVAADGTIYTDHNWINPTENDELIARDCSNCHSDLKAEVKAIQARVEADTVALGQRCVDFIKAFEKAIEEGSLTDEQLERLRYIQRAACFYWNYAAAENSEGAHNPAYYDHTLKLGHDMLDEADQILGISTK